MYSVKYDKNWEERTNLSGQREEGREGGGRGRKALGRGAVGLSLLLSEKGGGWSVGVIDKGSSAGRWRGGGREGKRQGGKGREHCMIQDGYQSSDSDFLPCSASYRVA